jgi:hypothetical protein
VTGDPAVATAQPAAAGTRAAVRVLRALAVLGLAVDVYVHLALAPVFDQLGEQITQGMLFRLEAALAAAAAVYLLVSDSRRAWLCAGGIALAGTAAVLVTRYVDVPPLGPIPDLSDPQWSPEKVWVTVAMATTVLAWLLREALRGRRGR